MTLEFFPKNNAIVNGLSKQRANKKFHIDFPVNRILIKNKDLTIKFISMQVSDDSAVTKSIIACHCSTFKDSQLNN